MTVASPFESGIGLGDHALALLLRALALGLRFCVIEGLTFPFLFESGSRVPFFPFESGRRVAFCFLVGCRIGFLPGARAFRTIQRSLPATPSGTLGSAAFTVNSPYDPTGRRNTTPGMAVVACTTLGSSVCFANPR